MQVQSNGSGGKCEGKGLWSATFSSIPCHPPDPFQDIPCHPDPFQDQHTAISEVTLWTLFVQLPRLSSIVVVRATVFYPRTPVHLVAWHSSNTANCCCYVYVIPPSKSARFALDLDIPSFSNAGPEKWASDDKLTTPPSWMLLSGHERNSTHILAMHYQHQFRRHVHFGNHVMWIVGLQTKFFRFTNQICRRVLPGQWKLSWRRTSCSYDHHDHHHQHDYHDYHDHQGSHDCHIIIREGIREKKHPFF